MEAMGTYLEGADGRMGDVRTRTPEELAKLLDDNTSLFGPFAPANLVTQYRALHDALACVEKYEMVNLWPFLEHIKQRYHDHWLKNITIPIKHARIQVEWIV